jgi:DNA gyrase/topoisomerase IV subunit B
MKKLVGELEPIPSKRVLQSIIADYDLDRSVCELVDNAIDQWILGGKSRHLTIKVDVDRDQQSLQIADDAGGVRRDNLEMLLGRAILATPLQIERSASSELAPSVQS